MDRIQNHIIFKRSSAGWILSFPSPILVGLLSLKNLVCRSFISYVQVGEEIVSYLSQGYYRKEKR